METGTLMHEVTFNVAPEEVFHALMDSEKRTQFTGAPATIARKPGGEFSLYGGQLTGKTLELKPNQRMVQQCGERTGSRATFHCSRSISRRWMAARQTHLSLTQKEVPVDKFADVNQGWRP